MLLLCNKQTVSKYAKNWPTTNATKIYKLHHMQTPNTFSHREVELFKSFLICVMRNYIPKMNESIQATLHIFVAYKSIVKNLQHCEKQTIKKFWQ